MIIEDSYLDYPCRTEIKSFYYLEDCLYNQNEYDLDSLTFYDDRVSLSVRVTNIFSGEDYYINKVFCNYYLQ